MNAVGPARLFAVGEEPDVVNDGRSTTTWVCVASTTDHVGRFGAVLSQAGEQALQPPPLLRFDPIICVEPEDVVTRGPRQRRVTGCGEVINPDEIEHPRAEGPGDLN